MEELKVPKWRTRVDVQMPGGQITSVAVYLSDFAHDHSGPERISDLLNGGNEFIPAHDLEHDQVVFLNRSNISVARVLQEIESDPGEQYTLPHESEVRVMLRDGRELVGLVTFVRPDDRARVLDFLNEPPPFFPLLEKDHVALINKHHVARVEVVTRPAP